MAMAAVTNQISVSRERAVKRSCKSFFTTFFYPAVFVSATKVRPQISPGLKVTSVDPITAFSSSPLHISRTNSSPVKCCGLGKRSILMNRKKNNIQRSKSAKINSRTLFLIDNNLRPYTRKFAFQNTL
uniref:Uncharacterized protein n=1 Tax=Romanomermis culicivorax TaxID=13658 RepID=A0A915IZ00_ROMCU